MIAIQNGNAIPYAALLAYGLKPQGSITSIILCGWKLDWQHVTWALVDCHNCLPQNSVEGSNHPQSGSEGTDTGRLLEEVHRREVLPCHCLPKILFNDRKQSGEWIIRHPNVPIKICTMTSTTAESTPHHSLIKQGRRTACWNAISFFFSSETLPVSDQRCWYGETEVVAWEKLQQFMKLAARILLVTQNTALNRHSLCQSNNTSRVYVSWVRKIRSSLKLDNMSLPKVVPLSFLSPILALLPSSSPPLQLAKVDSPKLVYQPSYQIIHFILFPLPILALLSLPILTVTILPTTLTRPNLCTRPNLLVHAFEWCIWCTRW